jgi:hypothetical protein
MFRRAIRSWTFIWALLLALSIVAWTISYMGGVMLRWSQIHWESTTLCIRTRELTLARGRVWAAEAQMRVAVPPANFDSSERAWRERFPPFQVRRSDAPIAFPNDSLAGFGYAHLTSSRIAQRAVMLPLWLATLLLAFPLLWRNRRRPWRGRFSDHVISSEKSHRR